MKIIAKGTFIHGSTTFKRGATAEVSEATGKALINAGLARETTTVAEKVAPKPAKAKVAAKSAAKPAAQKTDTKE